MRLDIVNHSRHKDAPVEELFNQVGVHIFHLCNHWHGARAVVEQLVEQRFYLEMVDDLPEAPGALGYHDVDAKGIPYSRIAVTPSFDSGSDWLTGQYSVLSVLEHEADETTLNPIINIWRDIDGRTETAQEGCDAVEDTGYRHGGADHTNFLLPEWFNPFGKAPFDYLGALNEPFSLTSGGYMITREPGKEGQVWKKRVLYGKAYESYVNLEMFKKRHTRGAILLGG